MLERSDKYVFVIYFFVFEKFHLLQTDYTRAKYGYFAPFCSPWSALVSPFFFFPEQTGGFASLYASSTDLLLSLTRVCFVFDTNLQSWVESVCDSAECMHRSPRMASYL